MSQFGMSSLNTYRFDKNPKFSKYKYSMSSGIYFRTENEKFLNVNASLSYDLLSSGGVIRWAGQYAADPYQDIEHTLLYHNLSANIRALFFRKRFKLSLGWSLKYFLKGTYSHKLRDFNHIKEEYSDYYGHFKTQHSRIKFNHGPLISCSYQIQERFTLVIESYFGLIPHYLKDEFKIPGPPYHDPLYDQQVTIGIYHSLWKSKNTFN